MAASHCSDAPPQNTCLQVPQTTQASCHTSLSSYVGYRENLRLRLRRSHDLQQRAVLETSFDILLDAEDVEHGQGRLWRDCGCLSLSCRGAHPSKTWTPFISSGEYVSLTALSRLINLATSLKDDVILISQPAEAQTSSPSPVLSHVFNTFFAAACYSISPAQANDAWTLLRHVIWHGAIDMDVSSIWEHDAQRRGSDRRSKVIIR
ncbi:uncharacterized protein F5891DRAFT_1194443 [Suillus fuscotomentosus]|uniref:Uncharacterized protein n=1 Tax=Suillus fuscotomentosus TaxID=1912939 RepID=A0AAD4HG15_9AGAM|nr:uncharacterized protein F5891DRAFT_1194443 [Suillus fuscotomentosus]KAG1895228.1 hypothetical protein F5891DRAFT_1194443 [Suillus fuscotomentosus]